MRAIAPTAGAETASMSERREAGIPPNSETQAEPTGWEAEPESTRRSETQAEPTGWEAEPESTRRSETQAEPTGGERSPESTRQ